MDRDSWRAQIWFGGRLSCRVRRVVAAAKQRLWKTVLPNRGGDPHTTDLFRAWSLPHRGRQGETRGDKRRQGETRGDKAKQGETRGDKGRQGETRGGKGR